MPVLWGRVNKFGAIAKGAIEEKNAQRASRRPPRPAGSSFGKRLKQAR